MASKYEIMAGQVCEIEEVIEKVKENPELLEDWIFVDIGFARKGNTCGVAVGNCEAEKVTFANLVGKVTEAVQKEGNPLNLLLEAPLSMAFTEDGNPWPRNFEWSTKSKGNDSPEWFKDLIDPSERFWYSRAGASTKAGAERLIWRLRRCKRRRQVRLFEGAASLKADHHEVADKLRQVVKGEIGCPIVSPNEITAGRKHTHLWPITGIEGWDSHKPPKDSMIPPVVWILPRCPDKVPENTTRQCPCAIRPNRVQ